MKISQIVCVAVLIFFTVTLNAQQKDTTLYKEKFAQLDGISLHYLDFGGSGLPLIFLQSFHGDAGEWVDYDFKGFAPKFTGTNHVYAITRRGWGKSSDPGWGYDVASNGEDVVAFMDALKIEKAIFAGRIPASMDMTWIAEHHPNRVAGLVYFDFVYAYIDVQDSLVREYVEMLATLACDLGLDVIRKSMPRSSWRPHFLGKQEPSIKVPALWFSQEGLYPKMSRELLTFDMLVAEASTDKFEACDPAAFAYFKKLAKDQALQKKVKEALEKTNNIPSLMAAFEKAFDPKLKIVTVSQPTQQFDSPEAYYKYWQDVEAPNYFKHMSEFIGKLKK
jgi:pimeloyl-ACP methyl ester carboxylesterase